MGSFLAISILCESNKVLPGPAAANGVGGGAGGGTVNSVRAVAACQTETVMKDWLSAVCHKL